MKNLGTGQRYLVSRQLARGRNSRGSYLGEDGQTAKDCAELRRLYYM
jgi:hypothetical protein